MIGLLVSIEKSLGKVRKMISFSEKLNMLRAGVLGANDGIVSTAGVVIGVAAATQDTWTILVSSLAAVLAGALSMAGGEYSSVSTQKDTEKAVSQKEQSVYQSNPQQTQTELYQSYLNILEDETMAKELSHRAMTQEPVQQLIKMKYNIDYGAFANPIQAAIASFISFSLGSLPPILGILLLPRAINIYGTVVLVSLSLMLTGYISAKLGQAPVLQAVIRNVMVGLMTMLATYLLGNLF